MGRAQPIHRDVDPFVSGLPSRPARELEGGRGVVTGLKVERASPGRPVTEKHPMKNSLPKITLSKSQDIPFNKLVLSQANVRQIKAGHFGRGTGRGHRPARPASGPQRARGARRRRRRDRHVRNSGRRPPLPRARTAGEAEAHGEDASRAVRGPHRRPRRGGFARRERAARRASSARPVPRLPDLARPGTRRGRHRRALLREPGRGQAEAQARLGLAAAARSLCRGRDDA